MATIILKATLRAQISTVNFHQCLQANCFLNLWYITYPPMGSPMEASKPAEMMMRSGWYS